MYAPISCANILIQLQFGLILLNLPVHNHICCEKNNELSFK